MSFKLERHEPEIHQIIARDATFRVALPEFYTCRYRTTTSASMFAKLANNLYVQLPGISLECNEIEKWVAPSFDKDFRLVASLRIHHNFSINSLMQWHQITQENPNFMIEQFDPNSYTFEKSYYRFVCISEPLGWIVDSFPQWMVDSGAIQASISKQSPGSRTIIHDDDEDEPTESFLKLSMPELAIVRSRGEKPNYILCLMRTRGNNYVPFYLPNVGQLGIACMGNMSGLSDLSCDHFWNSTFYGRPVHFQINENFGGTLSLWKWISLTKQNPDFFRDQLDPIYSEKISPVIYTIEGDQLSWRFKTPANS